MTERWRFGAVCAATAVWAVSAMGQGTGTAARAVVPSGLTVVPSAPATPPANPARGFAIDCEYRFYSLQDEEEINQVAAAIRRVALDGMVSDSRNIDTLGEYRVYTFAVTSLTAIAQLSARLPDKTVHAGGLTTSARILEEFGPRFTTQFRTVTLVGTVEVVVRFHVTKGAALYYSVERGQEILVTPDQIDDEGSVTLLVRLPRTQAYVFGRSVLGGVERYLRINVETGEAQEILQKDYRNR